MFAFYHLKYLITNLLSIHIKCQACNLLSQLFFNLKSYLMAKENYILPALIYYLSYYS